MARRTRRGIALALAVAAALAAGCSAQPGTAAVVGDHVISQATLDRYVADLEQVSGSAAEPRAGLSQLILLEVFNDVSVELGVGVTDHEAGAYLDEVVAMTGGQAPAEGYGEGILALATWDLASQQINAGGLADVLNQQVMFELATREIDVNPRFGDFDPETGVVAAESLPWLAG